MALSLEAESHVWQKVKIALMNASPIAQLAFKGLREYMTTHKQLPDLQFKQFANTDLESDGGNAEAIFSAAGTLYGFYYKAHRTSGTTAAFIDIHDASTEDATTTTLATFKINKTGQEGIGIWGNGLPFATDLTISSATAVGGNTQSAAGDGADCFIIVGA
jgi:hypothetical protein